MLKLFHCLTENTEISLWTEEQPGESDNEMLEDAVPACTEQQSGQPTVGGESYAWEMFHKFRDCSSYRETFSPVSRDFQLTEIINIP